MPAPERSYDAAVGLGGRAELAELRDRAVEVLTDSSLAHIVDLVAYVEDGEVIVANVDGASRIDANDSDGPAEILRGRDPIAVRDPMQFAGLDAELADPSPPNERNAYPYAGTRLLSLFADARAPDIAVVHTGKHYWPDRGGHIGEHGSLSVVQSRAPFLLSGAGVADRGIAESAARVVDVAPTLGQLAGLTTAQLAGLDGVPQTEGVELGAASYVIGLLWDGANCNSLLHLASTGELPAVARLLERGFALAGGAVAEFPSNTLCNHTAALTGVGPGRHGIVNNCYWDRESHQQILANESGTWHMATDLLRGGVPTLFEMVGGERTACVNEPVDRGAAYSTFALIRDAGHSDGAKSMGSMLPDPAEDPCATQEFAANDKDYRWSSQVDAVGLQQVLDLWGTPSEAPRLTWWNTTLTDTGHHNGGPHSEKAHASLRDADRRLGLFLDRLAALGVYDDCVILLTADHGSEGADENCLGDWDDVLRAEGLAFRDEAYGFIYLGV
ncbi:MAG: alkaline phosphatase family protein [Actinomycetes bacterium]